MNAVHGWALPEADQFMGDELKPDGTYQKSHYTIAMRFVTNRSCAIDGGAHIGTWSKLMSDDFARVIAIEPSADTFEALSVNMATFGCANVDLRNIAVGAKAGMVSMVLDGRGAALKNTGARHVCAGSDVRCEAIDAWQLPTLGLLKMDIEGSELAALHGACDTLTRCQPIVLFENKQLWRHHYGHPPDAPQRFLTSLGYRELAVAGCDVIWGSTVRH